MVTTSPIPFEPLPRQQGTNLADAPPAQSPFADAIDRNFTAVNTYLTASAWADRFKVQRVKPVFALNTANVKWYSTNNYVDGLIIGDLRFLMIVVSWEGALLQADGYGGITDQKIGTVTDTRFWPGTTRQLWFVGDWLKGMCTYYLNPDGGLWLAGLGGRAALLSLNDYFALNMAYLVDGS